MIEVTRRCSEHFLAHTPVNTRQHRTQAKASQCECKQHLLKEKSTHLCVIGLALLLNQIKGAILSKSILSNGRFHFLGLLHNKATAHMTTGRKTPSTQRHAVHVR